MSKSELQEILGYLNVGLAIAHSTGVSVGHFGNTDFIGLAQTVNGMVLRAISPVNGEAVVTAPTHAAVVSEFAPARPVAVAPAQ